MGEGKCLPQTANCRTFRAVGVQRWQMTRRGAGVESGVAGRGVVSARPKQLSPTTGSFPPILDQRVSNPPLLVFLATLARLKRVLGFAHAAPDMQGNRRASCCLLVLTRTGCISRPSQKICLFGTLAPSPEAALLACSPPVMLSVARCIDGSLGGAWATASNYSHDGSCGCGRAKTSKSICARSIHNLIPRLQPTIKPWVYFSGNHSVRP